MKNDRYAELFTSLKVAVNAAYAVSSRTLDGGTCNLDALRIELPRWKEASVCAIAESAGIRAYKVYGRPGTFSFSAPVCAQAERRTAQVEAMCSVMREHGYQAYVWYVID